LLSSIAHLLIRLFASLFNILSNLYVLENNYQTEEYLERDFLPVFRLSFQSVDYFFCCGEVFKFDIITFVNSCRYFSKDQSPVQKVLTYAYYLAVFPLNFLLVVSEFQILLKGLWPIWVDLTGCDRGLLWVF
jgi:hypothetical protein